jgi:uncharacterized membrane protein YjdF
LYHTSFWWDKLTHLVSGIAVASLVATVIIIVLQNAARLRIPARWVPFFILIAVMAMEAFWEIFEFTLDHTVGGNMQYPPPDTVNDIIYNFVSGIIAGLGAAYYISNASLGTFVANLKVDRSVARIRKFLYK